MIARFVGRELAPRRAERIRVIAACVAARELPAFVACPAVVATGADEREPPASASRRWFEARPR